MPRRFLGVWYLLTLTARGSASRDYKQQVSTRRKQRRKQGSRNLKARDRARAARGKEMEQKARTRRTRSKSKRPEEKTGNRTSRITPEGIRPRLPRIRKNMLLLCGEGAMSNAWEPLLGASFLSESLIP